jgi:hypothetical protein
MQVRKYLLRLEQTGATPTKYWKPNLLVLVDNCDTGMLAFCNSLKKGGLLVIAQVQCWWRLGGIGLKTGGW